MEDRKRALVSRLLQYALIHQVLGIPYNKIVIRRTAEGKPYLLYLERSQEYDKLKLELPNFNFNASHHVSFIDDKGKFDKLIEDQGVKMLIDPKALMHVIGTEMDFVDDKLRSEFIFVNPNATGQCSCGESFMTTTSSEAAKLRGKSS
ncbi:iron-sulfur assembly protein IscA-like 3, mitochondrial [Solanum stenotomum]|uniref:iron-sulfur assembly protein IscA-like 3, mitochondrial n=1 Tax=Solanum stenotomum TaxID=172797 RepID=UPI0020D02A9D|nr:iron-sulfur assembly protein IscA-like 3, mitochondrial [Solanum stenotomum]